MGITRTTICVSPSIANFRDKLVQRFLYPEGWGKGTCIFFGLYRPSDYLRFLLHRGTRLAFWCGGDILGLQKRPFWRRVIARVSATHICENQVEQQALSAMGINASIQPQLFDPNLQGIHPQVYTHSEKPHVYLTAHPGREREYGLHHVHRIAPLVPDVTFHIYGVDGTSSKNIVYHGQVSEDEFNNDIKNYQGALRLNEFDGFSEILAKSILMGQYPISRIYYPHITHINNDHDLVRALNLLSFKTKPNPASGYWFEELCKPLLA